MKVDELISQLEKQGLEIHIQRNKEQTSLYYLCNEPGNKFLEIHYNKADEVTRVKFHSNTTVPTEVLSEIEPSGDDDNSITKQIKFNSDTNNANDIILVAFASYNKVRDLYSYKN